MSRNQPVHDNRQMFALARETASIEEQKSENMSMANIASNEEGDITHYSNTRNDQELEANMMSKNRHLEEGGASFGEQE